MGSDPAVRTRGLSRAFGGVEVLTQCDLDVPQGSVYGVLGPNGAGKTTLFKIILGMLQPTAGTVEVNGMDAHRYRNDILKRTGSMIEVPLFYEHLSAADHLELHLQYMQTGGIGVTEALERVGLGGVRRQPVSSFSLGMRQRLGLARAIVHQPQLLILDEPTNGLDPLGRREIKGVLRELNAQGVTILIASHLLHDIEELADTTGIMVQGRITAQITRAELQYRPDASLETFYFDAMGRTTACAG